MLQVRNGTEEVKVMKTPEEIKKALKCCAADEPCGECPYRQEVDMCIGMIARDARVYIQQLEDHIRDLAKMVPHWISVKDRLPPKNDVCVLCHCDTTGAVTHWMPLPEPPEED